MYLLLLPLVIAHINSFYDALCSINLSILLLFLYRIFNLARSLFLRWDHRSFLIMILEEDENIFISMIFFLLGCLLNIYLWSHGHHHLCLYLWNLDEDSRFFLRFSCQCSPWRDIYHIEVDSIPPLLTKYQLTCHTFDPSAIKVPL